MSEISILTVLHPNAKDLYDAGRSLSELCQCIENPHSELSSFGVNITTFSFFSSINIKNK